MEEEGEEEKKKPTWLVVFFSRNRLFSSTRYVEVDITIRSPLAMMVRPQPKRKRDRKSETMVKLNTSLFLSLSHLSSHDMKHAPAYVSPHSTHFSL